MSKKKWRERKKHVPIFVFTAETITLTQKALALFEQPLHRANHLEEKVVFAEETMQHVKHKLEQMKRSVGLLCVTTFDFNEKIIIRQAMLLYTIELLAEAPTPKRVKEIRQCRQIASHFTDEKDRTQLL